MTQAGNFDASYTKPPKRDFNKLPPARLPNGSPVNFGNGPAKVNNQRARGDRSTHQSQKKSNEQSQAQSQNQNQNSAQAKNRNKGNQTQCKQSKNKSQKSDDIDQSVLNTETTLAAPKKKRSSKKNNKQKNNVSSSQSPRAGEDLSSPLSSPEMGKAKADTNYRLSSSPSPQAPIQKAPKPKKNGKATYTGAFAPSSNHAPEAISLPKPSFLS